MTNTRINVIASKADGTLFAGTREGVFRSMDNGDTWIRRVTGLTENDIDGLVINNDGDLFVGLSTNRSGVFRSTNNGDLWLPLNDGLQNKYVNAMAAATDGFLYVGTLGGGVFRGVDPTTAVERIATEIPTSFALRQNYPNPFNPTTTIEFALTTRSAVHLKVFDIMGRTVATLVNEILVPGTYKAAFDGKGLPSGLYFYRLEAGEFVRTQRLTLLK